MHDLIKHVKDFAVIGAAAAVIIFIVVLLGIWFFCWGCPKI